MEAAVASGDRCFVDEDYAGAVEHYTEVGGFGVCAVGPSLLVRTRFSTHR